MKLKKLLETFNKWLYIDDDKYVPTLIATILANRLDTDPIWLFVIGPSGCSKSEILSSFSLSSEVLFVSTLSEHSLVSGYRDSSNVDPSLINLLDGKTMIIKDFSTVLAMRDEKKAKIFSDFRDIYDRFTASSFGNIGLKTYNAKFGIIAGTTDAIDSARALFSILGERFIDFRPKLCRNKTVDKSVSNIGKKKEMRKELSECVATYLDEIGINPDFSCSEEEKNLCIKLANRLSIMRTRVQHDERHNIKDIAVPEFGTRVANQFLALMYALKEIGVKNPEEYIERIYEDSIPLLRREIIKLLPNSKKTIAETLRMSPVTIDRNLKDMIHLGIIQKTGNLYEMVI